jgi:hypothetical protein
VRLRDRVMVRSREIVEAGTLKSDILKTLSSSGALEALIALQRGCPN